MVEWLAGKRVRGTSSERTSLGTTLGGTGVGGWVELGRTTLGASNTDISVSSLDDKRYYMVLGSHTGFSSNFDITSRFNSDTGSTGAIRASGNGATDATVVNRTGGLWSGTASISTTPKFHVGYVANRSASEKLIISHGVHQKAAGAANAPERSENFSKWANTSDPIDEMIATSSGSATFNSGSELVVLGWDPTDTHTNNFWEELVDANSNGTGDVNTGTFTAKKYLWIQVWLKNTDATTTAFAFRTGNATIDSGNNYARRFSSNGAADGTSTSSNHFDFTASSMVQNATAFANLFMVNNSANEKLIIGHSIHQTASGAGTAPERKEFVTKWVNTSNQANIFGITDLGTSSTFDYHIKIWGAD